MVEEAALTRQIASSLLCSVVTEEDRHPWNTPPSQILGRPLLRTWDAYLGSQPGLTNCMLSRLPRQSLDTSEARKKYLTVHADHKTWTPTPFISFTTSAEAVHQLADIRSAKRGAQTITAVSPNVRVVSGLPILDMDAEMRHYEIPDPYKRSSEYYKDHYLCLWEVTEPEIVGGWEWVDLVQNDHWYEEIVMPAFKEHNERFFARPSNGEALNLSALLNALPDTPPVQTTQQGGQVVNDPSDSDNSFCIDWDTASEEYFENESDWYDTDDEIEEANAEDDMFKILEGNW